MLQARKNAKTAVNLTMVYAYYEIGRIIVEEEQRGERRAAYGQQLLKGLSDYLTQNFGKGFFDRMFRCFVLFDLKIGSLKHQDLGQMQIYVNYYDRYEKHEDENPTIGVLLCQDKDDSMVELTLPKDSNIFASKYQLYLPDKKLLQDKLGEWVKECDADKCTK